MTAQGSPYARLRRALDRRNVLEALVSARELEHVGLTEALELCLLLRDKEPSRFGPAAVRWHGRYCGEARGVDLDEALGVLVMLAAMRGPHTKTAASALAELLGRRRGLERACEALVAWARSV